MIPPIATSPSSDSPKSIFLPPPRLLPNSSSWIQVESNPVALVQAFTRRNKGADLLDRGARATKSPTPKALNRLSDYHRRTGQLPRALAQIFQAPVPRSLSALLIKENRKKLTAAVDKDGDPVSAARKSFDERHSPASVAMPSAPSGSHIGPNLVAVGAAAQTDYMIEAILGAEQSDCAALREQTNPACRRQDPHGGHHLQER